MNTTRHPTRPGSALIIVIGTLALISVFAAIYISVGQSDRRSAATVRQRADLSEITQSHADHVARIVARDRLDAIMQPVDSARQFHAPRRVTTDAPYTDWAMRSESNEAWRLFNPVGGNLFPRPRTIPGDDPRVPSDPWLAALRPTFLGDPFNRPFSENDPFKHYLDNRDWYQISNVAPDGRFVNLYNLRSTPLGGNTGAYDAEPGWGIGTNAAGLRVRRMSEGLSLYKKLRPNDPNSPIQSFDPASEGIWLPGSAVPVIPLGLTQDDIRNTPAAWTMFQRFAFLPADQSFVTYNRTGQVSSWRDPDYPPYQWADTTGDGMYDARWFELTAAREPQSASAAARTDIQRFYDNSEFRVFAAVRVVDLSGMVNINTAIDALTPPTRDFPLGLTPAEIDLRRLLTMQDLAAEYRGDPQNTFPLSYTYLHQPRFIQGTGNQPAFRTESDYSAHRHLFENPGTPETSPLDPDASAMLIGRYAAAALRRGMLQHNTLGAQHRGASSVAPDTDDIFLLNEGTSLLRPGRSPTTEFGYYAGGRAATYFRVGRADPSRLSLAGMAPYGDDAEEGLRDTDYFETNIDTLPFALYGVDDLAELLAFHGINDPNNTSRLERNMLGRFEGPEGEERISPLLSTRTLDLDRTRHGQVRVPPANRNPNRPRQVTGQIADDSMALFELSPRFVMTSLNGAVPLRPMSVIGGSIRAAGAQPNPQPAGVASLSAAEASRTIRDLVSDANARSAFDLFYTSLAGELEMYRAKRGTGPGGPQDGPNPNIINQIWNGDLEESRNNPYATLFYGHRGPELAMRIAAHTAVNLRDLYGQSNQNTVGTLVLDNQFGDSNQYRQLLQNLSNNPNNFNITAPANILGIYYPGLLNQTRFDIDAPRQGETTNPLPDSERVLPTNRLPERRQAVNVIGVEPMPVITEVASFYVYTDASSSAGGDDDSTNYPIPPPPGRPLPINIREVTINGTRSDSNTDFLAGVVAFQLHNPYDRPINLGGGTGPNGVMWRVPEQLAGGGTNNFNPQNNLEFDYYVEYNGWYFKLGEFWEYTPSETIAGAGFSPTQQNTISERGGTPPPANSRLSENFPSGFSYNREFQYRDVTLGPGQTRVFYAMFHPRFDWVDRQSLNSLENTWFRVIDAYGDIPQQFTNAADFDADEDGLPDGFDGRGWTGLAQEWIENQLRVNGPGVRVHPFDPRTGELVRQGQFTDFISQPPASLGVDLPDRTADAGQVRLWRKHTIPNYEENPNPGAPNGYPQATRRNIVQNDILVDRLFVRMPNEAISNYLEVGLPQTNQSVAGTVSFRESDLLNTSCGDAGLIVRNDNTGLSITRWASVRRRDRAESLGDPNAIGRVLPWMIQSRRNPTETIIRTTNKEGHPDAAPEAFGDALTWANFFEPCNGGSPSNPGTPLRRYSQGSSGRYDIAYSPVELFSDGMLRRGSRVATLGRTPYAKATGPFQAGEGNRFPRRTLPSNAVGDSLFGSNSPIRPEVFLGKTIDSARIAEALLALGIGPTWAPEIRPLTGPIAGWDANFEDGEWMTLPEAFAAALGYESFNIGQADEAQAANAVWHDAVRTVNEISPTPPVPLVGREYVLDNLRLRLDDYVPFINVIQPTGETGPNGRPLLTNSPNNPAQTDFRRGAGVPMALTVLDQLRPFGILPLPGDDNLSQEQLQRLPLTRPVMGLVNVQTAPLRVLRLLPGLTPSAEQYRPIDAGARIPEWWAAQGGLVGSDIGVARLQPGDFRDNPDVAAGIAAYRDRTMAAPRARSRPPENFELVYQPDLATNAGLYTQNLITEFALDPSFPRDRASIAGIPGIRGAPMFASLGELLAVSLRENTTGANQLADNRRHLTMQAYFGNQTNLGVSGDGATAVTMDPQFTGIAGVTPDDYAERLALAASIMNTTSVRSDYFAAWMVIQGFRENDVTGLQPDDPLVPSFKRRFLMVIDRSNVINPGDAPRIVLFRELPL
ncbi:MAG: hypothetical protein LAT64_03455 [Phycisphaerales bacterium]|nr:hypothetical protein [Planctomycetota bacterium]MCH8507808.1 hypothetical protein [Phycisphaerales bacterium]